MKSKFIYRSFELDPNGKKDVDYDVHDMLASKYGMSREQAKGMNDEMASNAQSAGHTYHFDTMVVTNTFDAHRLAHFAATYSKNARNDGTVAQGLFHRIQTYRGS
jgi:predicted DsbA family dithiol-disulfide isomerase